MEMGLWETDCDTTDKERKERMKWKWVHRGVEIATWRWNC